MRDYSFRYLDAHGRTQAADYVQLLNDDAAIALGRESLSRSDLVEVWAGNKLLVTLKADTVAHPSTGDERAAEASTTADPPATPLRRQPAAGAGAELPPLPPWIRPVR